MERLLEQEVLHWLSDNQRKPLIVRGARQVGKTWLVRRISKLADKQLIELNFEKTSGLRTLFKDNSPQKVLMNLEAHLQQTIDPNNSLLFLDEIQAAPEILAKLRWFYEDMPQLPVVAAGSLLEFALEQHEFSMPVGRVSYLNLEPLSFSEFLIAQGMRKLYDLLLTYQLPDTIPDLLHEQLMKLFKEYVIIGGLPAAVSNWIEHKSLINVNRIHHDLMGTYRDDFAKYAGKLPSERLDDILTAVPKLLGQKFKYSRVNRNVQSNQLREALKLLHKARLCHTVFACSGNGLPLAAGAKDKTFKVVLLDTGLVSASLGLIMGNIVSIDELQLSNQGMIGEQVVGQMLRTIEPYYVTPALYYWQREQRGSEAEVDYLIQHGSKVIPVEVKAGSTGTLKSLHFFMGSKNLEDGVRINSDYPSRTKVKTKIHTGEEVSYQLLSLPYYLTEQIHRLL